MLQKSILKTNMELRAFLTMWVLRPKSLLGLSAASAREGGLFCELCCLSSRGAILKIQTGNLGVAPDLLLEVTPSKQLSDVSSFFSPSVT